MKKQIKIEGMSCNHCVMHVKNALNEIKGVHEVCVSLEDKNAIIEVEKEIESSKLREVIEDAGYDVVSINKI